MCLLRRIAIFLALLACSACERNIKVPGLVEVGKLRNGAIHEASGLARSNLNAETLWAINDGGSPPILYAIGTDGSDRGSVHLNNASNIDWEDIASYEIDGTSWLVVADVGDNESTRDHVTLYIVAEPLPAQHSSMPDRTIPFVYPDGPRDAEAIAVDTKNALILILSKRTIPAVLYAVPLDARNEELLVATRLGSVAGIPQPDRDDVARAPVQNDWHWQPTGLDISADGRSIAILTYRAIYLFERDGDENWLAALSAPVITCPLGRIRGAEAVAFDAPGRSLYVTIEQRHAPLHRFDIMN